MLIEVFKHVPFRPRLKATLLVSKRLQGLIHEKSLWRKIETDKALVGPTLAYMIQPGVSGAVGGEEPLLPRGNVEGLAIDMAYVSLPFLSFLCTVSPFSSSSSSFPSRLYAFPFLY